MTVRPLSHATGQSRFEGWPHGPRSEESITVVVPPTAALVPISKSSEVMMLPQGMSKWVWASIPPGATRQPDTPSPLPFKGIQAGACL